MNKLYNLANDDIICALATVQGTSAIALIRVSGKGCIELTNNIFNPFKKNSNFNDSQSHTIHFGKIFNDEGIIDEVLVSVFRTPNSYTGEDIIEISCHGSMFIQHYAAPVTFLLVKDRVNGHNPSAGLTQLAAYKHQRSNKHGTL